MQHDYRNIYAIGLISKSGRYASGTYAHEDIALEFASWVSAEFKLYFIKEFRRLKKEENEKISLDWNLTRNILAGEASFTISQLAHYLLFMRVSALGRERSQKNLQALCFK